MNLKNIIAILLSLIYSLMFGITMAGALIVAFENGAAYAMYGTSIIFIASALWIHFVSNALEKITPLRNKILVIFADLAATVGFNIMFWRWLGLIDL